MHSSELLETVYFNRNIVYGLYLLNRVLSFLYAMVLYWPFLKKESSV